MQLLFSMYWVYDLPNWLFGFLTIAVYVAFGLGGLYLTRNWVRRLHKIDHSHNDIVGYYLAAVTVFYGITLGLVAVGTYNTYSAVNNMVDEESQIIASIYRDVGAYPKPLRQQLRRDMAAYTDHVIHISWPLQAKGIIPSGSGVYLDHFMEHLMTFQPQTMAEQINQAEVFKQYNVLVECRRARLNAVGNGLPTSLWSLVLIGGMISIVVTLFFDTKSFSMHVWMTVLISSLLGLMIFLIATLDHPFRGSVNVSSLPLELVNKQLILPNLDK